MLEEHSFDPNRPGRNPQYTRIKEALKKIDGMVMTDSIPETDPIREQGRKTTSFEESLRWIQEKLAKYDAADNQDAKSTGLQDPQTMIPHELPKSSPIPRISFPRKPIGESATLKEKIRWLESPSSTETERLKFPSIFKSDDRVAMVKSKQGAYDPPPRPDIERVATSPVDQENNEELAMKLSEKIQRLAQFITSPFSPELQKGALPGTRFRIPIDTPALRVIRSASWDALLYFSYFDLKAEEALVNLYKNPEHTAFLAAMFLTFDIGLHQMILCLQIQWQLRFRFKRACRQWKYRLNMLNMLTFFNFMIGFWKVYAFCCLRSFVDLFFLRLTGCWDKVVISWGEKKADVDDIYRIFVQNTRWQEQGLVGSQDQTRLYNLWKPYFFDDDPPRRHFWCFDFLYPFPFSSTNNMLQDFFSPTHFDRKRFDEYLSLNS